ncbi:hypothetical protein LguiB_031794 [Lonicera macranthoides]
MVAGGCGACDVLLSKYDPMLKQVENDKVNSCLTLLCSINGCSITTTEGLGNSKDGLHPIHKRMAGFHASQCGFCTPAMCISLFSALVNAKNANRLEPPPGFSKLTILEAEKHYDKDIDLRYIPELSLIRRDHTGIEIGATVPISNAILALREEHEGELYMLRS